MSYKLLLSLSLFFFFSPIAFAEVSTNDVCVQRDEIMSGSFLFEITGIQNDSSVYYGSYYSGTPSSLYSNSVPGSSLSDPWAFSDSGDFNLHEYFGAVNSSVDDATAINFLECDSAGFGNPSACVGNELSRITVEVQDECVSTRIGSSTAALLAVSTLGGFGLSALTILSAIIGTAVALLVIRWGWKKTLGAAGEERWYSRATGATIGGIYNKSGKFTSKMM